MRLTDIDLNLLRTFVIVAEEKGFSKAAKRLFVEQSAVSKAIKRLEENLGTNLFARTKRRVELTTKGMSLLPLARQVLESSETLIRLAQDKENELSGTLKFGVTSPFSHLFMPKVIFQISKDYPQLWPMMFTGMVDDLCERVKRRELEFALIGYSGNRLKELEYIQVAHSHHRLVISTRAKPEALNSFIGSREIHDRTLPQLPTFEKLKRMNKHLQIRYSTNDFTAYKELVLNGLGIGLLPRQFIKNELVKKQLRILHPEMALSFPVHVVCHPSYKLSLESERVIELFKEQLA